MAEYDAYATERNELPANTARALLNETREGLTRLDKSIEGLAERLALALGPAMPEPEAAPSNVQSVPKQTSDLVQSIHDLMDTARRLTIRVDKMTQRIEL